VQQDAPFLWCIRKKSTMKKILVLPFIFFLTLHAAEITGKVISVSDGDTISVLDDLDKGRFRIRLDKIDAPEKKQAFGSRAKQYLSALIFGKQVKIRFKKIDNYGRILGVIYCNGTEINLKMVQEGFAWHYSHYDKTPAYIEAEKQARAKKKGLWIDPQPVNPYTFRNSRKR
jgi:endonuclease YncB( thermonuclease family)